MNGAPLFGDEWCRARPSLDGYRTFLYKVANFKPELLPATSLIIPLTLGVACEVVNRFLEMAPLSYSLAVYNLATDRLVNFAPDVPGQTYFQDLRTTYGLAPKAGKAYSTSVGVVSETHDESTGVTLVTPESLKNLTLGQLQNLQTPWGATYLGIAQAYGSTLWGLS